MTELRDQVFVRDTDNMMYSAERLGDSHYRVVLWEPFIGSINVNVKPVKRSEITDLPSVYYAYGNDWVFIPF